MAVSETKEYQWYVPIKCDYVANIRQVSVDLNLFGSLVLKLNDKKIVKCPYKNQQQTGLSMLNL